MLCLSLQMNRIGSKTHDICSDSTDSDKLYHADFKSPLRLLNSQMEITQWLDWTAEVCNVWVCQGQIFITTRMIKSRENQR